MACCAFGRPSLASRRPLAPSRLPSVVEGGGGPGPRSGGIGGHAPEARLSASRRRPLWLGEGGSAATLRRRGCRPLGVVLRGGEGGPATAASLSGLPPASRSLLTAVRRQGRRRPGSSRRGDRRPRSGGAALGLWASSSVAGREGQPQRRPSPASRRPLAPSRLPSVVEGGGGPGPCNGGIGGHAQEVRLSASRRPPPWRGGATHVAAAHAATAHGAASAAAHDRLLRRRLVWPQPLRLELMWQMLVRPQLMLLQPLLPTAVIIRRHSL